MIPDLAYLSAGWEWLVVPLMKVSSESAPGLRIFRRVMLENPVFSRGRR